MNQCPICKSFQPDGQLFCPDCGSKLVPVQQETEKREAEKRETERKQSRETVKYTQTATSKSSKAVHIVLIVLLIAALAGDIRFYLAYSNYSDMYWDLWNENWQTDWDLKAAVEDLATAEKKLDQIQKEQAQTKKELDRFSELSKLCGYGTDNFFADKYILVLKKSETKNVAVHWKADASGSVSWDNSDTGKATCKWADEWSDSTTIDVIVTGQSSGYSILTFTNDVNDDTFDVLVIVKG